MTAFISVATLPGCGVLNKCGLKGCAGDAQITVAARDLLSQHPALQPPNLIDVQTLDHVVYLHGLVNTELERQMAETVVRQAKDVRSVVNVIGISGNR